MSRWFVGRQPDILEALIKYTVEQEPEHLLFSAMAQINENSSSKERTKDERVMNRLPVFFGNRSQLSPKGT